MEQMQSVLVDKCQARQFETSHQVDASAAIAARPTMTIEQEEALRHVCEEPGAVKIIDGVAGTGRRYLLAAAREAWETAGFEVVGPALSCAAGLGSGAGHSLLFQLDAGECRLSSSRGRMERSKPCNPTRLVCLTCQPGPELGTIRQTGCGMGRCGW